MASPAFLLWSSSSTAASSQENGNDDADQNRLPPPPDPAPKDSSPARPKRKKASKATAPKRPPQRGLGVAQLERLRLQERWKMITEIDPALEIQPFPGHLPVYDYPSTVAPLAAFVAPAPSSVPPPAPAAVAACGGGWGHAPGTCYIQRCQSESLGLAMRSVLHEPYQMGMGVREGRFRVGSPFPEPPSNQNMQCFSAQCEFCVRKKHLFGENPGYSIQRNGADYFEMDLAAAMAVDQESQRSFGCIQRRGKSVTESSKAKEFDFFPQSRSASLGDSEFGNPTVGDASSSSSSSAAASPTFLDLSLKLSI